jgi:hypothetical protein
MIHGTKCTLGWTNGVQGLTVKCVGFLCHSPHPDWLQTGLTAACISSSHSHEWVENNVLDYIKRWIPIQRVGVLAGSSVHVDKCVRLTSHRIPINPF